MIDGGTWPRSPRICIECIFDAHVTVKITFWHTRCGIIRLTKTVSYVSLARMGSKGY